MSVDWVHHVALVGSQEVSGTAAPRFGVKMPIFSVYTVYIPLNAAIFTEILRYRSSTS